MNDHKLSDEIVGKLDYLSALYDLIIQTNRNTNNIEEFKRNVDLMECMLAAYEDDDYGEDIKSALAKFKSDIQKFGEKAIIPKKVVYTYEWTNLKAKYSAIFKLIHRRKLSPQFALKTKVVGWVQ